MLRSVFPLLPLVSAAFGRFKREGSGYFGAAVVPQRAALPWYDLPGTRPHHQRLWMGVASRLRDLGVDHVPETLSHLEEPTQLWHDPTLLLTQACGLDAVLEEAPPIQVVATPEFEFRGCAGPTYRSFVVVRDDHVAEAVHDLRGARCVINSRSSHSGTNGLRALVAPLHHGGRFFCSVRVTGSHRRSLQQLRSGEADVAAIDCVTWGLLARHRPQDVAGIRLIAETDPMQAPPYVTRGAASPALVAALQTALTGAVEALAASDRFALGLQRVRVASVSDYAPIAAVARRADALGYRELGCPAVAG